MMRATLLPIHDLGVLDVVRAHQHELHDEIQLPQRRRCVCYLHHLAFEQERNVIDEFERHLLGRPSAPRR